ncbi:MAG TPA: SUMF1/EgtB/PvdO family nonheme iron enzyme [Saprospiraceae bacterium]|nr:SUMF1/EgtB/PvdO family nonheme iron enzyme [Saprospiraceae bacterium]
MNTRLPSLLLLLLLPLRLPLPLSGHAGPLPPARHDYALFFAVNDYATNSGFDDLSKPIANAEAIATELKDHYGFQVEVVKNPTLDQIEAKLDEYRRLFAQNPEGRYPSTGQLLIYFSGHGFAENNNGFFIPSDGQSDKLYRTAFPYNVWREYIDRMDCRHVMVVIDACYSVTFDPDWYNRKMDPGDFRRPGELSEGDRLLLNNELDKCRIVFSSDGSEDKVPERSNFARKMLEGLRTGPRQDGMLTSEGLAGYLRFASPKPRLSTFGSDENGSFLFVQKNANTSTTSVQQATDLEKDLLAWKSAKAANTIAGYENYLTQFPDGEFKALAQNAIATIDQDLALRRDDLAWEVAQEKNTRTAYEKYGSEFPTGRHQAEAESRMKKLDSDVVKPPADDGMVLIKGGTFQMGSNKGASNEKPVHTVTVSDFYLSSKEVTVAEFSDFVEATGYKTDAEKVGYSYRWGENDKKQGANWRCDGQGNILPLSEYNHPVVHVSWNDAVAYCNWMSKKTGLNYRLPTEAEWEYAAGNGAQHTRFSWGNEEPLKKRVGNIADDDAKTIVTGLPAPNGYSDGYVMTSPVGTYEPNTLGLYDMTGNVWEWCNDWFGSYTAQAQVNPVPKRSSEDRVVRGGAWHCAPEYATVTARGSVGPSYSVAVIGFRTARSVN